VVAYIELHAGRAEAGLQVTRDALKDHKRALELAAGGLGRKVDFRIVEGASESEIAVCESAIGFRLPELYRATLAEWNGCDVEIYEPDGDFGKKSISALFSVLNAKMVAASTRSVRGMVEMATRGSPTADADISAVSRIAVITYHDDVAAFVQCGPESGDSSVAAIDLEYDLAELPLRLPTIASTSDEYLEKCFNHLAKTLETEIFW
jgi:hypothetical protein